MITKWRVTLDTRKGMMDVDLTSTKGKEGAERRARWTLIHQREYGDIPEVTVVSSVELCRWFAACENEATGKLFHPVLDDVPICDRCRTKIEALKS